MRAPPRGGYFAVDGSIFLDGDYLIHAGRGTHPVVTARATPADGRVDFTNKEIRLDQRLELRGPRYLWIRLILLKRRLDEPARRSASRRPATAAFGRGQGDVRLEQA